MKKVIAFVLAFMFIHIGVSAYDMPYEYGNYLLRYDMADDLSSSEYWYVYKGRDYLTKNQDYAHTGKYSLEFNVSEARTAYSGEYILLNFHTTKLVNKYSYDKNNLYCEFFVRGNMQDVLNLKFNCYFEFSDGSLRNFTYFDLSENDDGWIKVSANIPNDFAPGYINTYLAIMYNDNEFSGTSDKIYLDDFSVRLVPAELAVSDVTASANRLVKLDDIVVLGKNSDGNTSRISDTGNVSWSVVSGNAVLNHGVLSCVEDKKVTVCADYLGTKSNFDVNFEDCIYVNSLEYSNETVSYNIKNDYANDVVVNSYIAVYGDFGLYKVYKQQITVKSGEEENVLCKVRIPAFIQHPRAELTVVDKSGVLKLTSINIK